MSGVGLVRRHTPSQTDAQHHVWIDHGFTNGSVVFPAHVWTREKKQWLPHDVYLQKQVCCLISTLSQSLHWSFHPSSHPTFTHLSYKTVRRWGISVFPFLTRSLSLWAGPMFRDDTVWLSPKHGTSCHDWIREAQMLFPTGWQSGGRLVSMPTRQDQAFYSQCWMAQRSLSFKINFKQHTHKCTDCENMVKRHIFPPTNILTLWLFL